MTSPLNDEPEFTIVQGRDAETARKAAEDYWAGLDDDNPGPER